MRKLLFIATLVVVFGINCSAADTARRMLTEKDLLSLRDIGGTFGNLSFSPDGGSVAFQLQEADFPGRTYQLKWFVASVDAGNAPLMVGDGGEVMLTPAPWGRIIGERAETKAQWAPDGRWIAYLRKDGGETQIWRSRVDGSRQEQVTHSHGDVLDFKWRPDGNGIYFHVGRDRNLVRKETQDEGDAGFLLDDRFLIDYSLEPIWFACGESVWGAPVPESEQCAPTARLVDFKAGERAASPEEETAFRELNVPKRPTEVGPDRAIQSISWSPSLKHSAWLENEDPKTYPGWQAPLTLFADGLRCSAPECHGQLKEVWWNGEEVVFLRHEGHSASIPAIYSWRPGTASVRTIYRLDSTLSSCEVSRGEAVCLQETPTTPRRIASIRLSDGEITEVFDPNPDVNRFDIGRVQRLEWEDGFGHDVFGHLVFPPDYQSNRRYPLIIIQYRSRGFLRGGVGDEYPIFPLAARGFVVLSLDQPNDQRLDERLRVDNLKDVGALLAADTKDAYGSRYRLSAIEIILDQLAQRRIIDPKRVGITGLSSGAGTVDYAVFNSKWFAAAAYSGIWSGDMYQFTINSSIRAYLGSVYGPSGPEAGKWKSAALEYNVDKLHTPLLIQVADRELIAELPEYVAFQDAHKPAELYVFPNEYHVKWQPQHKLAVAERAIDWFQFWLQGYEDPMPAKRAQYSRWRKLRELHETDLKKIQKHVDPR